jgi:hypothetical protein
MGLGMNCGPMLPLVPMTELSWCLFAQVVALCFWTLPSHNPSGRGFDPHPPHRSTSIDELFKDRLILRLSMWLSLNWRLCWPAWPSRRRPDAGGGISGNIRQRGSSLQVRFFAGKDPVTGRDVYLTASISGTDRKAHKRAEDKLAEFRTQVNKQRSTPSSVTLGYAITEWLRTSEHEDSTREGYAATSSGRSSLRSGTCRPDAGDLLCRVTALPRPL